MFLNLDDRFKCGAKLFCFPQWQGQIRLIAVYDGSDSRMPIVMVKGGTTYYLGYDQVGSLKAVADASGNVVKQIDYDSFGNVINDSAPDFALPFGFARGLHDRDTWLVRFGFRDYDPETGRWTAKDPIFFAGGDTDLYGYVLSDPVNFVDPTGEFGSIVGGAIGGAIVGSIAGTTTSAIGSAISGGSVSAIIQSAAVGGLFGQIGNVFVDPESAHGNSIEASPCN